MKKSIFLSALALVTGLALTGCKDDTQPRLQAPAADSFSLYAPANNNFTYDLSNNANSIILTTSGQPDYGVATPTQYQVQVSLNDTWNEGIKDPSTGEYVEYPSYYSLPTVNTQSVIHASALEINQAITYLQGIHEEGQEDLYDPSIRPIWVRVRAYVADPKAEGGYVPYSQIFSNSVKINSVQPSATPSLPLPAKIYIIGDYQGWDINGNDRTVALDESENGIGSDIYTGYLYWNAPADADQPFRFYTVLGDWETNSIGSQVDDNPIEVDMEEENGTMQYSGECVAGKGSWKISNFPAAGWMKLTVDLNTMTVLFQYDPDYSE